MIFFIWLAGLLAYIVAGRVVSKVILYNHVNEGCERCNISKTSSGCFNNTAFGMEIFFGSIFWPIFVILKLIKLIDYPSIWIASKLTGGENTGPSRAIRKANERLELAKIHEQEAASLEAAFESNARLLHMKETFNPLHIKN